MRKIDLSKMLPVFMAYIVMGFVDIVGVATGYIKLDFALSDSVAQLIPTMAFLWFFLLSVPTGVLQDKYGKKRTLNLGMALTGVGMLLPVISYSFPVILFSIVLLGIGNTIVQVSANPLLRDVVPHDKFSSYMSFSQFVKAICSLMGPIITTFVAIRFGNWKLVFFVYAILSFLAVLWLYFTHIDEEKDEVSGNKATFSSCFKLLGNKYVLMMVLAIFLIVGADVAMNTNIATFLQTRFGLSLEDASLAISIYFTALMIGRFLGGIILNWISANKFLFITSLVALLSIVGIIMAPTAMIARVFIFLAGFGSANLFPLIFSIAVDKMPQRVNEISGLMIMAVSGGAVIPPLMGVLSTNISIYASMSVMALCIVYVFVIGLLSLKKQ